MVQEYLPREGEEECVCMWYVCLCLWLRAHVPQHVCGGQRARSETGLAFHYLETGPFTIMWARVAGPQISGTLLSLPPFTIRHWGCRLTLLCPAFMWVVGIPTLVFMILQQTVYTLSHPYNPIMPFEYLLILQLGIFKVVIFIPYC